MGVSNEAKNVIPLKFFRKIKNKIFSPLVNSIQLYIVNEQECFYFTLNRKNVQTLIHSDKKFDVVIVERRTKSTWNTFKYTSAFSTTGASCFINYY
jgi:hypothetical protein